MTATSNLFFMTTSLLKNTLVLNRSNKRQVEKAKEALQACIGLPSNQQKLKSYDLAILLKQQNSLTDSSFKVTKM